MSLKGDRYMIDLQNEDGKSFIHALSELGIVKKVRIPLF